MSDRSTSPRWIRPLLGASLGAVLGLPVVAADRADVVIDNAGGGRNRIEVTGNSATNVQVDCAKGGSLQGAANVNSVNVDPRALQGRTVIVTGRNSRDVRVAGDDCKGAPPAANVNSVNIR